MEDNDELGPRALRWLRTRCLVSGVVLSCLLFVFFKLLLVLFLGEVVPANTLPGRASSASTFCHIAIPSIVLAGRPI